MKPFSQACENNKDPILNTIKPFFADSTRVLEIGSGTGQHAVYFSHHLPHLIWQPSDRRENLPGIKAWRDDFPQVNLQVPIELDITQEAWPAGFDTVFSANTAHIMPWDIAKLMVQKVANALPEGGKFALYGPFNYSGEFTSESNERFDRFLRETHPHQGIRDFEGVNEIANTYGLVLLADNALPANNRLILWQKR